MALIAKDRTQACHRLLNVLHIWSTHHLDADVLSALDVEFNCALIKLSLAQHHAKALAQSFIPFRGNNIYIRLILHLRKEQVQQALFDAGFYFLTLCLGKLRLRLLKSHAHQIPDDRFDIAPDIPDFGVFCCFNFNERSVGKLGNTPSDLRLPHSRGSDHDDILWRYLIPNRFWKHFTPGAISNCDSDRALCSVLTNNIFIELRHNLFWLQLI